MKTNDDFWKYINTLVQENEIIIDRPKGSKHPKYTDMIYEFDYVCNFPCKTGLV
jgi:inorganic pyrophosphatase